MVVLGIRSTIITIKETHNIKPIQNERACELKTMPKKLSLISQNKIYYFIEIC